MFFKHILDSQLELLLFERFDEEIGRSHFHGFDNRFRLSRRRKDDDGNGWIDFLYTFQNLDAVDAGHDDIENYQGRYVTSGKARHCLVSGFRTFYAVSARSQKI